MLNNKPSNLQRLIIPMLGSVLLHALAICILLFWRPSRPAIDLERTVVNIHFAKQGQKRDEKLLPRFDASEVVEQEEIREKEIKEVPPKVPENKKPEKIEKVVPAKIKAPAAKSAAAKASISTKAISETKQKHVNPLDLLKKRFGKPSDEGSLKGSVLGTSLQQDLQNSYAAQVGALIKQSYNLPAVLQRQQNELVMWVRLRISAQGKLLKVEVMRSSGKTMFDNAVLVGIRKIDLFGAPPLQLRQMIATEGLELEFVP